MAENSTSKTYVNDPKARKIGEKLVSKEVLNLNSSSDISDSVSGLANNGAHTFSITLSNAYGLKMFGIPTFTLYESSVSDANKIPDGSNISAGDYIFSSWLDWQDDDSNNLVLKVYVQNKTGSSQDILLRASFRYMIESGSAA